MTFLLLAMPEPLLEVWRFEVVGNTYDRELLAFKPGVLSLEDAQRLAVCGEWPEVLSKFKGCFRSTLQSLNCF